MSMPPTPALQASENYGQEKDLEPSKLDPIHERTTSGTGAVDRPRIKVFVHDSAYSTYRAVLFYVSLVDLFRFELSS